MEFGVCPRCGAKITKNSKGVGCSNKGCKCFLFRDNTFFQYKDFVPTDEQLAELLTKGEIFVEGLHSSKTGKTYSAYIVADTSGDGWIQLSLRFPEKN